MDSGINYVVKNNKEYALKNNAINYIETSKPAWDCLPLSKA